MKNTELKYLTTPKQVIQHLAIILQGKDLKALEVLARQIVI